MCLLTKDVQSALLETGGRSKTAPLNTGSEATRHLSNTPSARLKRTYKAVSGPGARYRSASCARWAPVSGRAVFHRSERNVFPAFHPDCGGLVLAEEEAGCVLRTSSGLSGARRYEFKLKHTGTHLVVYSTRISNVWLYVNTSRLTFSTCFHCRDVSRAEDDLLKYDQHVRSS